MWERKNHWWKNKIKYVDSVRANRYITVYDLYHNNQINTIDISARNIKRMIGEVYLGAYQPRKIPFPTLKSERNGCFNEKPFGVIHWSILKSLSQPYLKYLECHKIQALR